MLFLKAATGYRLTNRRFDENIMEKLSSRYPYNSVQSYSYSFIYLHAEFTVQRPITK
jgi:hypothetical protein